MRAIVKRIFGYFWVNIFNQWIIVKRLILSKNLSSIKGLEARKAAWEVIQSVGGGAFADVALDRILNLYSFKAIDKALITELSYGAIRQRYFLDCWIDFLGKVSAKKQPP